MVRIGNVYNKDETGNYTQSAYDKAAGDALAEQREYTTFGDLPPDILSNIFNGLSLQDKAKLSTINREFREAVRNEKGHAFNQRKYYRKARLMILAFYIILLNTSCISNNVQIFFSLQQKSNTNEALKFDFESQQIKITVGDRFEGEILENGAGFLEGLPRGINVNGEYELINCNVHSSLVTFPRYSVFYGNNPKNGKKNWSINTPEKTLMVDTTDDVLKHLNDDDEFKSFIPVFKCFNDLTFALALPLNEKPMRPKVSKETMKALMPLLPPLERPRLERGDVVGGGMKKTNMTKRVMGRDRIIYKGKHGKEYVKSKGAFVAVAKAKV